MVLRFTKLIPMQCAFGHIFDIRIAVGHGAEPGSKTSGGVLMKLEGKVALITGGGTGIGAAIARRFAREGARVCITGRRREKLAEVASKFPPDRMTICQGDVSKEEDVKRMVKHTLAFGGKIDILVNNAGVSSVGALTDITLEDWHYVLNINLIGPFLTMKEVIPHMIKNRGGSIINIASVGGLRCLPARPAYCTSKAGLIMLAKQVALDYGKYGIRCNAVCPGGVITEMTEKGAFGQVADLMKMDKREFFKLIASALPLKRFAEPMEMEGICVFLASDESSFVTGSVIIVDGGAAVVDVVGAFISKVLTDAGLSD